MQAQELSEANVKIGLLEKKVESIDSEIAHHVGAEKEETEKMKEAMENQERSVGFSLLYFTYYYFSLRSI